MFWKSRKSGHQWWRKIISWTFSALIVYSPQQIKWNFIPLTFKFPSSFGGKNFLFFRSCLVCLFDSKREIYWSKWWHRSSLPRWNTIFDWTIYKRAAVIGCSSEVKQWCNGVTRHFQSFPDFPWKVFSQGKHRFFSTLYKVLLHTTFV